MNETIVKCPWCDETSLRFLELLIEDETEQKTAWACNNCNIIVYLVRFKEEEEQANDQEKTGKTS